MDDQGETVLLNVFRGMALRGLCMKFKEDIFIRLDWQRERKTLEFWKEWPELLLLKTVLIRMFFWRNRL